MKMLNHSRNVFAKFAGCLLLLTALTVAAASAGQVDPRFDGQWAGVETITPPSHQIRWAQQNPQVRTVFLVTDKGQTVRVISGFVVGKYWVEPKSEGETLVISGNNGRFGRNSCRLELSSDGNTIRESGIVSMSTRNAVVDGMTNRPVKVTPAQIYATFKRVGPAVPTAKKH